MPQNTVALIYDFVVFFPRILLLQFSRVLTMILVPRSPWPYFAVSDSRFLQPGGPGPRTYIPQEQGGPVISPGTAFPFRRLLRLAGLRWRYSTPPPRRKVTFKNTQIALSLFGLHSGTRTHYFRVLGPMCSEYAFPDIGALTPRPLVGLLRNIRERNVGALKLIFSSIHWLRLLVVNS
jgi:hypothetical protein